MAGVFKDDGETADGFQVVRHKKGKRRQHNVRPRSRPGMVATAANISTAVSEENVDINDQKDRIHRCREQLIPSIFYTDLIQTLETALDIGSVSPQISTVECSFQCPEDTLQVVAKNPNSAVLKYESDKKMSAICVDGSGQTSLPLVLEPKQSELRYEEVADDDMDFRQGQCEGDSSVQREEAQAVDIDLNSEQKEFTQNTYQKQFHSQRGLSMVVYGLGNFSSCVIARYQLALILALRHHLKIRPVDCHTYDPRQTAQEKLILEELGFMVIQKNEEGKHRLQGRTLVIMPHCGKALFNNLLWANWSPKQLELLVVLGNSFSSMLESMPQRLWKQNISYIATLQGHMIEKKVRNSFSHTDIFNDLSVHWFPAPLLAALPAQVWLQPEEPVYDTSQVEIILNQGAECN